MPAFVTHVFFGDLVGRELQGPAKSCIEQQPAAFFWGLQGPDLLFFRDAVRGKSPLPSYGGVMHKKNTGELFAAMAQYIAACPQKPCRQILTAYFMGFLCHYYLDFTAHPYVYFLQEQKKRHTPKAEQAGLHNLIESDIDTALHRLYAKKPVGRYRIAKELQGTSELYQAVGAMYCHVLKEVYGITVESREMLACFSDTLFIIKAVLDPTGLLLPMVQLAERYALGKPNSISAHIRRNRTYEDILNQRKKLWHHLSTPQKKENLSFLDLMEQAKTMALTGLSQWFQYVQQGEAPMFRALPSFDNGAPAAQ